MIHPLFDFIFCSNHSSGHTKKKQGGLDADAMSKWCGGTQSKMSSSLIKQVDGHLGLQHNNANSNMVKVGELQHIAFQEQDDSPFCMTQTEKDSIGNQSDENGGGGDDDNEK